MTTIAYGFYDVSQQKERVKTIRSVAKSQLKLDVVTHNAEPLDAIAEAVMSCRKGNTVVMIGAMGDLVPPTVNGETVDTCVWRESVLALLQDEGIGICLTDIETVEMGNWKTLNSSKVIREYRHARDIIDRELTNRIKVSDATKMASKGKKYGRPPYGYKTEKGRLKVDRPNAEAVSLIFRRIRENKRSLRDILAEIKEVFPVVPGTNDPQFWDHVKLRRIIRKARLYCLGEYSSSEGSTITIADLAFLPPEWADTTWPSSKPSDPQE